MYSVSERNQAIRLFLNSLYQKAGDANVSVDESSYKDSLDKLFQTTVWGFREVLLVVISAMALDPSYRASTGFYDCNPRAIYEGPIKEFHKEKGLPHRKSGPLNIAKATVGLDKTWAAQRRPSDIAQETVRLIKLLELNGPALVENMGVSLLRRLIRQTDMIQALSVNIEPTEDTDFLYFLCHKLIVLPPDAGNAPQKVAALLLQCYHLSFSTGVIVTGGEDRASVTSTTSKKPGDINEERDGQIYKVYEVTVKPFDQARIVDSYDCILTYNTVHGTHLHEVLVLCRPQDCPAQIPSGGLHGYLGCYTYRDILYSFIDLFEWIALLLLHMPASGRTNFYRLLNAYVNDINTAVKVKQCWQSLHRD